jgi:hypothetical protein
MNTANIPPSTLSQTATGAVPLWEGYPKPRFRFTLLAGGFIHIPYLWAWLLATILVGISGFLFVEQGDWEWSGFFGGLWLLVLVFPDVIKWIYKNGMVYRITEESIIYDLGKHKQYALPLTSIRYVEATPQPNGTTTLHFFTTGTPVFQTHDYQNLKTRVFPTFECIERGAEVLAILEDLGVKRLK